MHIKPIMTVIIGSALILLAAGCGDTEGDTGAGGVTAADAAALDEAAQKLDKRDEAAIKDAGK
jgi:hypothetical protein